jgi:threonine dehydratase
MTPDRAMLEAAATRLHGHVHHTPVLTSHWINQQTGAQLFFKCENFQKVGAFKFRGATNALLQLSPEAQARGVTTHSSGNHAQALALAAQARGLPAWIVMPENAPAVKRAAVEGYGATVIACASTLAAREITVAEVIGRTGATFIHPYNDPAIIAGQATAALELLAEQPLDALMAPVGGGGLLSGTALAAHHFAPDVQVYGAEPAAADDAYRSLISGQIEPSLNPQTIADGLLTSLGDLTFPILQRHLGGIYRVSEAGIIEAMRWLWERMKIVVEPSGAVPLAAVIEHPEAFAGRRVGLIVSGGNVDIAQASAWFTRSHRR